MEPKFNPKPAEDYPTLLKQFQALIRLHSSQADYVVSLRNEVIGLLSQIGLLGPGEAESQRDANAELTTLLEQQEIELARLRNDLDQTSIERNALREELLIKPGTGETAYRAAADIYYQLATECGIPKGGSLVTYVDNLRDAAQDLVDVFIGLKGGMTKQEAMEALTTALDASSQGRDSNGN